MFLLFLVGSLLSINLIEAQANDPNQGLRAIWLRGTWGINWKPVNLYNGGHEGLSIEPFLNQISHIKTIDYIQVHLGESSIKSSVHMGPHPLLESFWEGDVDENGDPINLVVPRASYGEDPFLEIVKAIRKAGLKVMVYVNSSNMLSREGPGGSNPDYIPNITERWKEWCDTNAEAQAFIASQPYHTGVWDAESGTYINAETEFPERKYMFCYAEFILKDYAIRYGDLLDSWCFDSGSWMGLNGDSQTNGVYEDQMIFNAFKAACHAGNPNAALSFQNSPERDTEELNPFSEAVHADDFMFGHPYNGGKDGGSHVIGNPSLYSRNYAHIEKMKETNGYAHRGSDPQTWTWDDNVVAHYDPPMSTTSWNGGNTAALTDDEFNLWNLEAVQNGGAISWGLPLVGKSGTNEQLVANNWALAQLNGMDAHLMELEAPGAPNWARQETILSEGKIGQAYQHVLEEGKDFWDPESIGVTSLTLSGDNVPAWLQVEHTETGVWTLTGTSTDASATTYIFDIVLQDADGSTSRTVSLSIASGPDAFTDLGDGTPVWIAESLYLTDGNATENYVSSLVPEVDFYDFEGDDLEITKISGASWLQLTEGAQESWNLSGNPTLTDIGENIFTFRLSDGVSFSDVDIYITVGHPTKFEDKGDGSPVWHVDEKILHDGKVFEDYKYTVSFLEDFYDFEGDDLEITKVSGATWLQVNEISEGIWELSGKPVPSDEGEHTFVLNLSDGVNASQMSVKITVNPSDLVIIDGKANVVIKANGNTDYGVNQTAVMYSEVLTAFDGKATFQLSVNVTPQTGKSISSGVTGGLSTSQSWGLSGDGRATSKDNMFFGESSDMATIENIQVSNFEANGGSLTLADFENVSFKSLMIVNGQSFEKDAIAFTLVDETTELGNLEANPFYVELEDKTLTSFSIGTGNSINQLANKWSIEEIVLEIDFNDLLSVDAVNKQKDSFALWPNPTTGNIYFNDKYIQQIQIFDFNGKLLKEGFSIEGDFDISELNDGVYFVKFRLSNGNVFYREVIKKN